MCSQPPRDVDDSYLVEDILAAIPWMSPETVELGITGGEPTLLHDKLLEVIATTKEHLPNTALHMLSNGRLFSYPRYAHKIAELKHPDFMIGIPLYADNAAQHDFVVQSVGAFDQTVMGMLNLARFGVRIELRIVIHRFTHERLPQFAHYVVRNLPFVDQVSLMGLELMGYARSNLDALWIDPADYQAELTEAVAILEAGGVRPLIFNHQLCVLNEELHPYAAKSISDWKNTYLPACAGCALKKDCGGFFASSSLRHSKHIHSIDSCTMV
jgi:His-Xaa-Ser system radical SAM maturase HxsC